MELVSPPHFVYDFLREVFLMLYSINWPNFIVWLPLLLEVIRYYLYYNYLFPSYVVIYFEINFEISYMAKSRQNLNILRTKSAFNMK